MRAGDARVLLTGANGGIGQAIAMALVSAGAAVMLAGRSQTRLAAQARALLPVKPDPWRVNWHEVELREPGSISALGKAAAAWCANVVVHCAGAASFGRLESVSPEEIAGVFQANLVAPVLLTRELLPHLRSLERAQVICVGSALGAIGVPGFSVYSASKFGLRGFAQALRRELRGSPVLIQYLGPRSTRTAFNSAGVEAFNRATGTAVDSPELVADALVALLVDEAAERFLGFPEKLAARVNGLAPSVLDASFARHRRNLPAPFPNAAIPVSKELKNAN